MTTKVYSMNLLCLFSIWTSLVAQMVKNLPAVRETQVQSLGQEDPLEEGMATHSSVLAWRIPRTEEASSLQSMGWKRAGHNWATLYHFILNLLSFFPFFKIVEPTFNSKNLLNTLCQLYAEVLELHDEKIRQKLFHRK